MSEIGGVVLRFPNFLGADGSRRNLSELSYFIRQDFLVFSQWLDFGRFMEIESQTSRSYQNPTSVPVIFSFLMVKARRRLVEMAKSSILWRFMRSCIVFWGAKSRALF